MTSKRKMPVNVLEGGQQAAAGAAIIDDFVTGGEGEEVVASQCVSAGVAASPQVREKVEARRLQRAQSDVHSWALFATLVGLVQVGFIAFLLIVGLQLRMISGLANRYEIFFPRDLLKRLVAGLLGAGAALWAASMLESLLFGGGLFSIVWLAVAVWGSTLAVGKIFIKHFEAGETLLDLDPTAMKDYFRRKYGETG